MRTIRPWVLTVLCTLAVVLHPGVSHAKGFGRGGGGHGGHGGSHGSSAPHGSPAPSSGFGRGGTYNGGRTTYSFQGNSPYRGTYGREGYRGSYGWGPGYSGYGYYEPHPYWWGYYGGWGIYPWGYYAYGYYPIWGAPPVENAPQEYAAPRTRAFSLYFGGAFPTQGVAPNGSLSYEGQHWGFNMQGIGLVSQPVNPNDLAVYFPVFSAHVTYAVISNPHARLRVELGGSGVWTPGGNDYYGFDVGTSGQLALAGPLNVYGAAHYTPYPARVLDTEAGLGLTFGGLGLRAGWRYMRLDDSHYDPNGGIDSFSGPAVSIGAVY